MNSGQSSLRTWEADLDALTDAERRVYRACELGRYGVTEYAQSRGYSKGTVGNLLGRAREKVREQQRTADVEVVP